MDEKYPAGDLELLARFRGVEFRPTELWIGDLDRDGWAELIRPLARLDRAAPWWFGDAVLHAQQEFRMPLYEVAKFADVRLQTLKNVATVARHVAPEVRIAELPWRTHRPVARIDDPREQRRWLATALECGWGEEDLRRAMADSRPPGDRDVDLGTPDYRCPGCGHEWSGQPRPATSRRLSAVAS